TWDSTWIFASSQGTNLPSNQMTSDLGIAIEKLSVCRVWAILPKNRQKINQKTPAKIAEVLVWS
ncbi:MAG TPA: hypothetical protein P5526_13030, partial [Anaerolineae bacterium]|nr:hypothetical protein [Anaerolineae bacterium]